MIGEGDRLSGLVFVSCSFVDLCFSGDGGETVMVDMSVAKAGAGSDTPCKSPGLV